MKAAIQGVWAAVVLGAAAGRVWGVPVEVVQGWAAPGTAGWTNELRSATVTNAGGVLNLRFGRLSAPRMELDRVGGDLPGPMWVTNVTVRFLASGRPPGALRLVLRAAGSGRVWQLPLTEPPVNGWTTYVIPVAYTPAWYVGPGSTEADFAEDRRQFDRVGLYVRRHGLPDEQVYGIDDLVVQGFSTGPGDGDGDGVADDWEQTHALNPDDPTDGSGDEDLDGMSNYAEFRAGTDPNNPDSRFMLGVGDGSPSAGIMLRWSSISNRFYTIWRAPSLHETNFSLLQSGVESTPPTNTYPDPSAVNLPAAFYRIEVDPE